MITFTLKPGAPQIFERLINEIQSLDRSKQWAVLIDEKPMKRSTAQNRYYWKCLGVLSKELGYTPQELHEAIAARLLGVAQRTTIYGQKLIEPISTTSLSTKEFADYMDRIIAFAWSFNINLPDPSFYGLDLKSGG